MQTHPSPLALALAAAAAATIARAAVLGAAIRKVAWQSTAAPAADTPGPADPVSPIVAVRAVPSSEGLVIRMRGDIDEAVREDIRGALAQLDAAEPGMPVLLDASDVTFMDSAGVRLVEHVRIACEASRSPVVLLDPPAAVTDVLRLARVDARIPVVRLAGAR